MLNYIGSIPTACSAKRGVNHLKGTKTPLRHRQLHDWNLDLLLPYLIINDIPTDSDNVSLRQSFFSTSVYSNLAEFVKQQLSYQ